MKKQNPICQALATKSFIKTLSGLFFVLLLFDTGEIHSQVLGTYNCTGGTQSYVVPAGVCVIKIKSWGGGGGGGGVDGYGGGSGGGGAYAETVINVSLGDVLTIYVGCKGLAGSGCSGNAPGGNGGWGYGTGGKGGNAGPGGCSGGGGGGGGSSGVLLSGTPMIIAAGGGGGGGAGCTSAGGIGGAGGVNGGSSTCTGGGNAAGNSTPDGVNGQTHTADGGGGGGGGGGAFNGGQGGPAPPVGGSCNPSTDCGAGGGGGGNSYSSSGTIINGSGATPGNSSDPDLCGGCAQGGGSQANGNDGYVVILLQLSSPIIDAGGYASVCQGTNIIIGGSPTVTGGQAPWTYAWTPTTNLNCNDCPNPLASPSSSTTYTIFVTDANGCTGTDSIPLYINQIPVANFTVDTPCLGFVNNFTDLSLGSNVGWYWTFGDGDTSSQQNPSHLYAADGIFNTILLVTTDSGCVDTIQKPAVVHPVPNVNFTVSNACLYDSVNFVDNSTINSGSNVFWLWNFGDTSISIFQNPSHLYTLSGTYNITLIITSDKNCTDTTVKPLVINPSPAAGFSTSNVCRYDTAFFTDNSSIILGNVVAWNWNFGDSNLSILQNPNNLYSTDGTFNVSLIVTSDSGCLDSITYPIVIHPIPVAYFTTNDICAYDLAFFKDSSYVNQPGSVVSWNWDFGDGYISTLQNPYHLYATYDTLNVRLIVTTDSGCVDTVYGPIIIYPQPVTWFVADTTNGCELFCVQFTDSSTIPGNYSVTGWNWNLDDNATSTGAIAQHCYNAVDLYFPGIYTITLITTSNVGCTDTLTQQNMITVWPVPIAGFTDEPNPATILFPYINFTNTSQGGSQYDWNMGDGATYDTTYDPFQHIYSNVDTVTYIVQLITENFFGCLDTAYDNIIMKGDYIIFVPNAFTPDNDGVNDLFFPQGIGFSDLREYDFYIYDRWGDLVFHSYNADNKWDGRANNGKKAAQEDVYVWLIIATDFKEKKHQYIGHVTLLR